MSILPLKPRLLEYLGASLKYVRVEKLKFLPLSYSSVINAVLLALNPPLDCLHLYCELQPMNSHSEVVG